MVRRRIKGLLIRGSIMKITQGAGRIEEGEGEGRRKATNDEPFEKQSTISRSEGAEPLRIFLSRASIEPARQIPRDFCPGKLHKFSRGVCHFLPPSLLSPYFHPFPLYLDRGKFNIRCNRWQFLRVEYKIEKLRSGTADC